MKYSDSGVNIDKAGRAIEMVRNRIEATYTGLVIGGVGAFGGAVDVPDNFKEPVLVNSIDGVGTKSKVAVMAGKFDTIGRDLVNHSVNDILTQLARPLFFMDYLGIGYLRKGIFEELIFGITEACLESSCSLVAGETAEMPGVYGKGDFDLVGSITGIVEKKDRLSGEKISAGDLLLGLPSNGLHTNGYSMVRTLFFEKLGMDLDTWVPDFSSTLGDELLRVHRSYADFLKAVDAELKTGITGIAHITGGGMTDNLPRILPRGVRAEIDLSKIPQLPVFRLISEAGKVPREEMLRTFNMGVGLVVSVKETMAQAIFDALHGFSMEPFFIGVITKDENEKSYVRYIGSGFG